MIEIRLTEENLNVDVLPSIDTNDKLHVILSENNIRRIKSSLWESIFTDPRLYSLSLINIQLYHNDTEILVNSIRDEKTLVELVFNSVLQSVHSFDSILNDGLQKNRSIKKLTITNFKTVDAATIASLIRHNSTIEYLSLVNNQISTKQGDIILDALKSNSTLATLDIRSNRLGKEGVEKFQQFSSSKTILLNDNDISEEISPSNEQTVLIPEVSQDTKIELPPSPPTPIKYRLVLLILVTFLFFLWGIPNQLNGVLIRQFMKTFTLSRFEAGLVQSAFYMGYFIWALPAAYVLRRWGYKVGILLGLVFFGTGSFLFWPAALIGEYLPFLISLFVIATGLAFLETSANPFIANAAGPIETSEQRLNIAQAFNPLGAIAGGLIGTLFIFSGVELDDKQVEKYKFDKTYDRYLQDEILRTVRPYVVLGVISFLWALIIVFIPFPTRNKKEQTENESNGDNSLCRPFFFFSVIALFAYVGAQVGTWSYFIQYAQDYVEVGEKTAGYLLTGTLAMFALGRFLAALLMHFGFSPSILLATFSLINVLLITITVLSPNSVGLGALFITSFFMSLMFPTIFALGIKGLSEQTTKLASCLLIMAIIGGAIVTPLMGLVAVELKNLALAYVLPGGAYLIIAIYALLAYVLTASEKRQKKK